MKNNTAKMIIVLTVIGLFSGGVLAVLDGYTKPKIELYKQETRDAAVKDVMPSYDRIQEKTLGEGDMAKSFFVAYKQDIPVAVAFEASGSGFQSQLTFMLGVTPDFSQITGLKILDQKETPGLGTKIENDPSNDEPAWFISQFKNLKTKPQITYVKNAKPSKDNEIMAITGATISSKAVVGILNKDIKAAQQIWNKK